MLAVPMPPLSPRTTLLLLLALAAVILGGGLWLARQEETVRVDRDREALRRFSGEVQAELQRLDALYKSHLARLARTAPNRAGTVRLADALAQILGNLLSNVEKYVPGGAVEIASTLAGGALTVMITDEGPGIPSAAAERIFRPFERLDSRVNEGASGTGLGLAIARDLAASMGGSLRLVPSKRGAAFELRVPAPPAQTIASVA